MVGLSMRDAADPARRLARVGVGTVVGSAAVASGAGGNEDDEDIARQMYISAGHPLAVAIRSAAGIRA